MSWPMAALADLGKVNTGSTPKTADPTMWGGETPFVTPSELGFSEPIYSAERGLTAAGVAASRLAPEEAVLVCCIGSLGKTGFAGRELVTNQQINWIDFDKRAIFPRYGYYACERLGRRLSGNSASTTIPIINKSRFSELRIPVPPLDEQRRIAAILDKADALRRKRKRALELLDGLTQSIFLQMFEDDLLSEKGSYSTVGDIADLQNGAYFPADRYAVDGRDGVEMVHMSDAFYGIVDRGELKRIAANQNEIQKYSLTNRDILIARRSLNIEGAAKPCLIPLSSDPLIYESSFIRVRPSESLRTRYLFQYLSSSLVRKRNLDRYITQATISGINQSNLSKVRVLIPPATEQDKFTQSADAVDQQRLRQNAVAIFADKLFASLQHRAFSGQL